MGGPLFSPLLFSTSSRNIIGSIVTEDLIEYIPPTGCNIQNQSDLKWHSIPGNQRSLSSGEYAKHACIVWLQAQPDYHT